MSALNLPDKVWVKILGHLNVRSLLNASETCSRLNYVIGKSEKLMKMIRLNIEIPVDYLLKEIHHEQNKLKGLRQIKDLKYNLLMSQRVYRNFGLSYLGRCRGSSVPLDEIMTKILLEILEIFQLLCKNVIDFKIQYCNFFGSVFLNVVSEIRNVEKITILDSEIQLDYEQSSIILPKFRHFHFIDVGIIGIKYNFLRELTYSNNRGRLEQDTYIMKKILNQKRLKVLHLECYEVFCHDVFLNPEIFLESLSLKCEKWKNMDHAESFFKKQIHLQDISLKLSDCNSEVLNFRYNDILKQIFSSNHSLSTIDIEIDFEIGDATFLDGFFRRKVTSLSFRSIKENIALFAALIKMCPKIKKLAIRSHVKFIDDKAVRTLVDLQSLTIDTEGSSMQHIVCAGRLLSFSLKNYGNDEDTKIFFSNHQSIEHLIISNDIVSRVLCEHIVNYLPNLRSFEFDKLEYPSETLQMLLTLKNLRSLKSKLIDRISQVKDLCTSAEIESGVSFIFE